MEEEGCVGGPAAVGGRVPDFFIVGNPKSGTTALYEMLRRHPQIFMPALKEPHFFAAEELPPNSLPRTLEEYLALFAAARPNQRAGEASPSYLRSPVAAGRIAQLAPAARIVAILREPASFVRSLHMQYLQDHVETERDLRRAIAQEEIVRDGRTVLRYSERVRYVEQLRRFHELFGRDRVLVLIYDDFRADNEATVRRVLRFLEVDDGVAISPLEANPTVRMRSVRLARLTLAVRTGRGPLGRALNGSIRALTSERMRAGAMRVVRGRVLYGAPQPPDEELDGGAAAAVCTGGGGAERVPRARSRRQWGYDGVG